MIAAIEMTARPRVRTVVTSAGLACRRGRAKRHRVAGGGCVTGASEAEDAEAAQQPHDDSDDYHQVNDRLDGAVHRDFVVDQPQQDANDDENDDSLNKHARLAFRLNMPEIKQMHLRSEKNRQDIT